MTDPRGWIISKDPEISPSKWDIAEIIGGFQNPDEAEANAKMMAASKEMHAALFDALCWIGKSSFNGFYGQVEICDKIRKAIEAAELWVDDGQAYAN